MQILVACLVFSRYVVVSGQMLVPRSCQCDEETIKSQQWYKPCCLQGTLHAIKYAFDKKKP